MGATAVPLPKQMSEHQFFILSLQKNFLDWFFFGGLQWYSLPCKGNEIVNNLKLILIMAYLSRNLMLPQLKPSKAIWDPRHCTTSLQSSNSSLQNYYCYFRVLNTSSFQWLCGTERHSKGTNQSATWAPLMLRCIKPLHQHPEAQRMTKLTNSGNLQIYQENHRFFCSQIYQENHTAPWCIC